MTCCKQKHGSMCKCSKMGDSYNMFDKNPSAEESPEITAITDQDDSIGEGKVAYTMLMCCLDYP